MKISAEIKNSWLEKVSKELPQTIEMQNAYGATVKKNFHTMICHAPEEVASDPDVAYAAITLGNEDIQNIHTSLIEDKNFIKKVYSYHFSNAKGEGDYIYYDFRLQNLYHKLPEFLQKDIEMVFLHLKTRLNNWSIKKYEKFKEFLPEAVLKNRDFILKALPEINLYDAIKTYHKNDEEIVLAYLDKNHKFWTSLNKTTKSKIAALMDERFIIKFIDSYPEVYELALEEIKEKSTVVKKYLSKNGSLKKIPKHFLSDRNFVKNTVIDLGYNLLECDKSLHNDRELIELTIKKNGKYIANNVAWQSDEQLVMLAVKSNPKVDNVSIELLKNRKILQAYITAHPYNLSNIWSPANSSKFGSVVDHYKNDTEMLLFIIDSQNFNRNYLQFFGDWRNKPEICDKLFKKENSFFYLSNQKINDKETLLDLIKKSKAKDYEFLLSQNESYFTDQDLIYTIVEQTRSFKILENCPGLRADKQFINRILNSNLRLEYDLIKCVDPVILTDKQIMSKFIKTNASFYKEASLSVKNDINIIYQLLHGQKTHYQHYYDLIKKESTAHLQPDFYESVCSCNSLCYSLIPHNVSAKDNVELLLQYAQAAKENGVVIESSHISKKLIEQYKIEDMDNIKSSVLRVQLENKLDDKSTTSKKHKL